MDRADTVDDDDSYILFIIITNIAQIAHANVISRKSSLRSYMLSDVHINSVEHIPNLIIFSSFNVNKRDQMFVGYFLRTIYVSVI